MWKKLCVAYFLLLLPHLVVELDKLSEELPFLLEWIGLSRAFGHFPNLPKDNAGLVQGKTLAQSLFGKLTKGSIKKKTPKKRSDWPLGSTPPPPPKRSGKSEKNFDFDFRLKILIIYDSKRILATKKNLTTDTDTDTLLRVITDVAIHVLLVLVIENALKMHFSASSQ